MIQPSGETELRIGTSVLELDGVRYDTVQASGCQQGSHRTARLPQAAVDDRVLSQARSPAGLCGRRAYDFAPSFWRDVSRSIAWTAPVLLVSS